MKTIAAAGCWVVCCRFFLALGARNNFETQILAPGFCAREARCRRCCVVLCVEAGCPNLPAKSWLAQMVCTFLPKEKIPKARAVMCELKE